MMVLTRMMQFETICRLTGKWGLYISFSHEDDYDEVIKAAPYLEVWARDTMQVLFDGSAVMLFDTCAEMNQYFEMTVGDDGPTKLNSYNGPARVYALTCDPTGQTLTENT